MDHNFDPRGSQNRNTPPSIAPFSQQSQQFQQNRNPNIQHSNDLHNSKQHPHHPIFQHNSKLPISQSHHPQQSQQQYQTPQAQQIQQSYSPLQNNGVIKQQIREEEFEGIMNGKQNEVEYWKNKQAKTQIQVDEAEDKVKYLGEQYDSLRAQYIQKQQEIDSTLYPLKEQLEGQNQTINQLNPQLEDIKRKLMNANKELNEVIEQNNNIDMQSIDLQRKIHQLEVQNETQSQNQHQQSTQEEQIKRAQAPHHSQNGAYLSPPRSAEEEDVIQAQAEMIDRQKRSIESHKQQIIEKDNLISELQQHIWQTQQFERVF